MSSHEFTLATMRAQLADQEVWKGEDPKGVIAALTLHRILARHGPYQYCEDCPYREITDGILERHERLSPDL